MIIIRVGRTYITNLTSVINEPVIVRDVRVVISVPETDNVTLRAVITVLDTDNNVKYCAKRPLNVTIGIHRPIKSSTEYVEADSGVIRPT